MNIDEKIKSVIRNLEVITPFEIIRVIQDMTAVPFEKAVKGYYYYKNEFLDEMQDTKAHEYVIESPEMALVASLDVRVTSSSSKEYNALEALKIGQIITVESLLINFNTTTFDEYNWFKQNLR